MTCASCGGELALGAARCPLCDVAVVPRVEGALAADPRLLTPPARVKVREAAASASREPHGSRRREPRPERSWRDEVQERIRSRRQKRADAGLPLFEQPIAAGPAATSEAAAPFARVSEEPVVRAVESQPDWSPAGELLLDVRNVAAAPAEQAAPRAGEPDSALPGGGPELLSVALSEAELADLPLRPVVGAAGLDIPDVNPFDEVEPPAARPGPEAARTHAGRAVTSASSLDPDVLVAGDDLDEHLELTPHVGEPLPVERPARGLERTQAAAFDLALFAALGAVAVYFAGRAARVELVVLAQGWPWLAAFLAVLAAFYASYFTGTTGQTPGKLLLGLRVVDRTGRPPGYARATARAFVGLLGACLAGAGLVPIAFDPAGRALHDRLFRTRVVRR